MTTTTNENSTSGTGLALRQSPRTLLCSLTRELYQTEESASTHSRREARRLGDTPPARALAAVADHAEGVLRELPALSQRHGLPVSGGGRLTGKLFSAVRNAIVDRLVDGERSYRGTLLGMRHGIDVVKMLRLVAEQMNLGELVDWADRWMDIRIDLVQRVEAELVWFAQHPDRAVQPARPLQLVSRWRQA